MDQNRLATSGKDLSLKPRLKPILLCFKICYHAVILCFSRSVFFFYRPYLFVQVKANRLSFCLQHS